jgi:hypothetical protein
MFVATCGMANPRKNADKGRGEPRRRDAPEDLSRYFNGSQADCELFCKTLPAEAGPRDANEFVGRPDWLNWAANRGSSCSRWRAEALWLT